jgi:hypothetical protein
MRQGICSEEIVRVFQAVGSDYPSDLHGWSDKDTGEMKWSIPPRDA